MNIEHEKEAIVKAIKEHAAKLPLEFVIGAILGGGVFMLTTRKSKSKHKAVRLVNSMAKAAAPFVIITLLEWVSANQAKLNQQNPQ